MGRVSRRGFGEAIGGELFAMREEFAVKDANLSQLVNTNNANLNRHHCHSKDSYFSKVRSYWLLFIHLLTVITFLFGDGCSLTANPICEC